MRTISKLTAAAICVAGGAVAAPAMADPPSIEHPVWQGWYIGANLGGSWSDSSTHTTVGAGTALIPTPPIALPPSDVAGLNQLSENSSNKSGFTGGIEGGYNFISNHVLWGIETDWGGLDNNDSVSRSYQSTVQVNPPITPLPTDTVTRRLKTNWIWTLRPRLGVTEGPWLFYGTIGLAMTDAKLKVEFADNRIPPNLASAERSETLTGWAGGLGGAYAISDHWSIKGEWLYADFGSIHATANAPNGYANVSTEAKVRSNLLRVGVDYTF